jgi:23S rRNA (pseudouridine1915-N3)-methyltransferase
LISLHDRYSLRISRFGVKYDSAWVPETKAGGFSDDQLRHRDAEALLAKTGKQGRVIALHPGGRLLGSEQVAERLEDWATPSATFIIGGPLGLHETVLGRAEWQWSLSPLTFPHELVRVLLAEQVYRAMTILRRVPYHK